MRERKVCCVILGLPSVELTGEIAVLALAANLASVVMLMRYKDGDANVRSVWLCSRNDAIGNVMVMIAAAGCVANSPRGRIVDRTFENQSYRASGLNLVTAAIVYWNTVYLGRVVQHLRSNGKVVPDNLLQHVAPLGWNHISLTGDYLWTQVRTPEDGFRPLNIIEQAA